MLHGGWTTYAPLTDEERKIFETATEGLLGARYAPFAVAKQVVNGTNYRYLCNAAMATNPPREFLAKVDIYKPLDGDPIILEIHEIA